MNHVTEEKHLFNCQTLPRVYATSSTIAMKMLKVASKLLTKQARHAVM